MSYVRLALTHLTISIIALLTGGSIASAQTATLDENVLRYFEVFLPYDNAEGVKFNLGFDASQGSSYEVEGAFEVDVQSLSIRVVREGMQGAFVVTHPHTVNGVKFNTSYRDYQSGQLTSPEFGKISQFIFFRKGIQAITHVSRKFLENGEIEFLFKSAESNVRIRFDLQTKALRSYNSQTGNAEPFIYRFRNLTNSDLSGVLAQLHFDSAAHSLKNPYLKNKQTVVESFTAACDLGLPLACDGKNGVAEESSEQAKLYRARCVAGFGIGCFNLGVMNTTGKIVEKDRTKATELFVRSCDQKIGAGCYNAALDYFKGKALTGGVEKNLTRSTQLYEKGCALDHMKSCDSAGDAHRFGRGQDKNENKALEFYEKACDVSTPSSCVPVASVLDKLAQQQEDKAKAKQSYERAVGIFQQSCEAGDTESCYETGRIYDKLDREADAISFFTKACTNGYSVGCYVAGLEFSSGVDEHDPDLVAAAHSFDAGCKLGSSASCFKAGNMYSDIKFTRYDLAQALPYFKKVCEMKRSREHRQACMRVGKIFEEGLGVEVNIEAAKSYYLQVCNGNYQPTSLCGELDARLGL